MLALMVLMHPVLMLFLASHAYKHPLVGSSLPDGVYELIPDPAGSLQEVQQPPPAAEVPADQEPTSTPAPEYSQGKHRYMSPILKYSHL
jgi:hypothetical protein